jgi:hypothetical protein
MQTLPIDAMVTILLYLIGAPALLIQNAESDVRYVLRHQLRRETDTLTITPAIFGIILILIALIYARAGGSSPLPDYTPELILGGLLGLAVYVSIIVLPISRKRDVIKRLRGRMLKQVRQDGRVMDEDMEALVLLGTESKPGNERFWTIHALSLVSKEILALSNYKGCSLGKVTEAMRKVILGGEKIGAPENFVSAVDVLRPMIQTYYQKSKENPWFADADLDNAYLLLSQMGQRAMDFPIDGIASTCLEALDGPGLPNSAASQRLSEIGSAAIAKDRIGPARESLHILDYMVANGGAWCENEEVMFDYLALLAAFWNHTVAGREEALGYIKDLKSAEAGQPDQPPPADDLPEGQIPETRLGVLVKQAIRHHSSVGRFTTSDNIRDMWISYTMD